MQRRQFDDKEIQTTIEANVRGREVIVVASASGDPNKQEKEARLLMRAARRSGAKSVTLVLPYMWYGRSDDNWDERNSPALIDTIETLHAEVADDSHSDDNSISAILRGCHPDQKDPEKQIALPAPIKNNSPQLRLK